MATVGENVNNDTVLTDEVNSQSGRDDNTLKRSLSDRSSVSSVSEPIKKKPVTIKPLETDPDKVPKDSDPPSAWCKFLYEQFKVLNDNFTELANTTNFACDQAQEALEQNAKTNSLMSEVSKSIEKVVTENAYLREENINLKESMLKLECQQRRENLVFEGLDEELGETDYDCYNKIVFAMSFLPNINPYTVKISRCHRVGPFIKGRKRPIVAHFNWYGDRQFILHNRGYLPRAIGVHEDFPQEIEDRRRSLKPILKEAKTINKYKNSYLTVDKLIIGRKVYTVAPRNNLNELPPELNPETVSEKRNDQVLVFFGQNSVFSNFHPAKFTSDNIRYSCNEQFIQASKAKLFDDDVASSRIMKTDSPYVMKQLGSRIKNFNRATWAREAPAIARKGLMAKFSQNSQMHDKLLATGERNIAEATREKLWGNGVSLQSDGCLDVQQWAGRGVMGDALIYVRDALKNVS